MKAKHIFIIVAGLMVLTSFTLLRSTTGSNQLYCDFKGVHNVFSGNKFLFYDDSTHAALFGGAADTTYNPVYRIELKTFKRVPGNYAIGSYVDIALVQKLNVNGIDSIVAYNGQSGHINIISYDTIQGQIEGSFNCVLVNYLTNDTLSIKNGYFNIAN
jgi:hypothetical protein